MKKGIRSGITDLRKIAEDLLSKRSLKTTPVHSEAENMKLLHELEVHQIELEMQNEELIQAKEQAETLTKKYTELYDFAPTGYFTLSKEGKIIELNLSGANLLGKERQGLKNSKFHFFISEYSKPIFNLFLNKVFNKQLVKSCEVTLLTYENSLKYVYLTGLLTENGEHCLVNVVDITERKSAEEKLKKKSDEFILLDKEISSMTELILANKELAYQNKELEKHLAELKIKNRELEQFAFAKQEFTHYASIASHELQEPIHTISYFIRKLKEDNGDQLNDSSLEYLNAVKDAATKMTLLINTLLSFSRLSLNKKLIHSDCGQLIDNVITDLESVIKTSNAVIKVGDMPKLNLYETEIRQLFQNLILNAIKFRKKDTHPQIHIKSEKLDEEYRFSVSDNGKGMAADHFEKIFDISQSLNDDLEFEGSRIGLAYCKKIVHMHHGDIWVESKEGQGSTFYFTIPNLTL